MCGFSAFILCVTLSLFLLVIHSDASEPYSYLWLEYSHYSIACTAATLDIKSNDGLLRGFVLMCTVWKLVCCASSKFVWVCGTECWTDEQTYAWDRPLRTDCQRS